jgi:hypothetical protein
MIRLRFWPVLVALLASPAAPRAGAITLGTVDNFQAGTTAGWAGGAAVTNLANAGLAGAGDNALRVSASNRVAIVNTAQWTGDFAGAGVRKLLLDIRNDNAFPLQIRLGLARGTIGSGGSGDTYVSASAVPVPADGQWHRIALSLAAADLAPHVANSNPTPSAAFALQSVSHFRILHNPAADFLGGVGPAIFLLDNITAIPEPATLSMAALALGVAAVSSSRRRSRRS